MIPSAIGWKINKSLPQVGNKETEIIRKHNYEEKWHVLQSRNTLSNNSYQHRPRKSTHQEKSSGKNKSEARNMVPVRLHQALTSYLKWFPGEAFLSKGKNIGPWNGAIYIQYKKLIRRCIRRGRGKFSGGRGVWGGRRIGWGESELKVAGMGEIFLGCPFMKTGWEVRGNYKGGKKGEMVEGAVSGWASLSILRCGSRIIALLGEIMPLGRLPVREKLACKDRPDWPDRLEGTYRKGQGRDRWIDGSSWRIGITSIGSWGTAGGGKRRIPPISLVLLGERSIHVSAAK